MSPAQRAFLTGLVDYAGLFPPANLDLDPALRNFVRYQDGDDAWMLGRFILPARLLDALDTYAALFEATSPARFSVLGRPAVGDDLIPPALATLADARQFEARHAGAAFADRFEFRLSQPVAEDPTALAELFAAVGEGLMAREGDARTFFEVPLLGDDWRCGVDTVACAVADFNRDAGRQVVGVKLRCGGVTPDAFPTVEALACALIACRDAGAPFKGTAGLHHPVRHYNEGVGAPMHGFLNVFGGAILARSCNLDQNTLERLLMDENADHFSFQDGFTWLDHGADADAVVEARAQFATTYGSCSFDEPREDLHALGMLDAVAA